MSMGLTIDSVLWIIGIIGLIAIADVVWLVFLTRKIKHLLGGTQAKDIQEALVLIRKDLDKFQQFKSEINAYLETVEHRLKRSVQSVETLRFNPFKGTGDGGNQSFSMAFIDENGDGVIISSLYTRERVSVFSKPIKKFISEFELSEEEAQVLKNSQKKITS